MNYDLLVIGGGASGVFAALAAKESCPHASVQILERTDRLLEKVRLSGGGRCNITNNRTPLSSFVQNYPRGSKELLGPLHHFGPQETVQWFESHGVRLKTEAEGRIFPVTNSSQTVVSCLSSELTARGVGVTFLAHIRSLAKKQSLFEVQLDDGACMTARFVILATGSSPSGYALATSLGHTLIEPIPALFALKAASPLPVSGVCVDPVVLSFPGTPLSQRGSLLTTHFGFSGPAALKLSSLGARMLYERGYKAELSVNWLPDMAEKEIFHRLASCSLDTRPLFDLPKSLWKVLIGQQQSSPLPHKVLREIAHRLHDSRYAIDGLCASKEEFVTCGGIRRDEICWKRMESRCCPGLFCTGELLDVDGLTGGFNLQNAWTTGFLAGRSVAIQSAFSLQ